MGMVVCLVVAVVVSCHRQPPPEMPRDGAWIEIAEARFAKTHSNVTKHTALPFDFIRDGVNGTQLMLQFLDTAEGKGAKYASNIAIVLQMEHDGATIECVSKIVPEGTPPPIAAKPDAAPADDEVGTTTIRPWIPNLVTANVVDHKFVCETVAERPEGTTSAMEGTYLADQQHLGREYNTPAGVVAVTADWHDACRLDKQQHEVTRYEHYVVSHFEPPDWAKLGRVFGGIKLVELPPECHAIAKPAKTFQRVEADLGYSGQPPQYARKPMRERLKVEFSMNHGAVQTRQSLSD